MAKRKHPIPATLRQGQTIFLVSPAFTHQDAGDSPKDVFGVKEIKIDDSRYEPGKSGIINRRLVELTIGLYGNDLMYYSRKRALSRAKSLNSVMPEELYTYGR